MKYLFRLVFVLFAVFVYLVAVVAGTHFYHRKVVDFDMVTTQGQLLHFSLFHEHVGHIDSAHSTYIIWKASPFDWWPSNTWLINWCYIRDGYSLLLMGDMILQTPTQQIKPEKPRPIPILLCKFSVNIPNPIKKHGSNQRDFWPHANTRDVQVKLILVIVDQNPAQANLHPLVSKVYGLGLVDDVPVSITLYHQVLHGCSPNHLLLLQ